MCGHAQFQGVADRVDVIEDPCRRRDLLVLVKRIGAVQAESPLASRAVDGIVQRDIDTAGLDAGEIASPVVQDRVDPLAAVAYTARHELDVCADGFDLRSGRITRDHRGEVRLLGEKGVFEGTWRLNLPLIIDFEVRR